MMPRRPIAVSATGQNACKVRPYFPHHQSNRSCGKYGRTLQAFWPDLVMLQDDHAIRVDDEADIEEPVGPFLVTGFRLRHDEDAPFLRQLAEPIGLRAGDVDCAGPRKLRMIDVEYLVIKALQPPFGD